MINSQTYHSFVRERLIDTTKDLDPDELERMSDKKWNELEMNARFLGFCDEHNLPETAKSRRKFNNWYFNQKSSKPAIPHPWFAPDKRIRLRIKSNKPRKPR